MITVEIHGTKKNCEKGSFLSDIVQQIITSKFKNFVAAKNQNKLIGLSAQIFEDCSLELVSYKDPEGKRILEKSLLFLFSKACFEILPTAQLSIEHCLDGGFICELTIPKYPNMEITPKTVGRIKNHMNELRNRDVVIFETTISTTNLVNFYERKGESSKVSMLQSLNKNFVKLHFCDGFIDFTDEILIPSAGYMKDFNIIPLGASNRILIKIADPQQRSVPVFETTLLKEVFLENQLIASNISTRTLGDLNKKILDNQTLDVIKHIEAFHQEKISFISDEIVSKNKRIILVAGPSSSGKTTFSKRLADDLLKKGMSPMLISTDDYFIDRDKTPLDEFGKKNFECIECIDMEAFNEDINNLLKGKVVNLPTYDFVAGTRVYDAKKTIQFKGQYPILIIEGIHSLNPQLTYDLPEDLKYKVYISPITSLKISSTNLIDYSSIRLLRRIVRDYKFRGRSADITLSGWDSVRQGEKKYIYPYQGLANAVFNSDLLYELAILKCDAVPLLKQISQEQPEFVDAERLLRLLDYVVPIENKDLVPPTSILGEFIGTGIYL